jgi:methylase of polypeptide subunit release factors
MTANIGQARETIRRCIALREAGKAEAVLRSELQSGLRVIFPSAQDKQWIDHYVEGTEVLTKIAKAGGVEAARFIDNLVGSTTVEYESDLRNIAKRDVGFAQVREHAAGLVRSGLPPSQVRGILSDTVEWHAYDAVLSPDTDPLACTPEDVTLTQIDELVLVSDGEPSAERLIAFLRKHFAREQSRPLRAAFLASDLGLQSSAYKRHGPPLQTLVSNGRGSDPSIALATSLWSQFVDHLEGESSAFRTEAYVDEAYIGVLARLLSANVLEGRAISSDDSELKSILTGAHFRDKYDLQNMVEEDYFGWLIRANYVDSLVPIAREIQHDLYAYDFSRRDQSEDDLFGQLLAQLARKSQRKLLGQEWTPTWLARQLAECCLENLPDGEPPRIVDMCCGSGSILAEVLKAARTKLGLAGIDTLQDVAWGFDIDPLAVALSKTTWVVTLSEEIKTAAAPIVIPVYHADSLFAVTPVSAAIPMIEDSDTIDISLDGATVKVPHALVRPEYRELFDRIIDWAYDRALDAKEKGKPSALSMHDADAFLTGAVAVTGVTAPADVREPLVTAIYALATRMAELAAANRNGIWAFILRNTYRPGLLAGQFNGLVSNPPWLAMSGLADNPYRKVLTSRAKLYGIRPAGQSFLHLELGTTHLLHAVDRYLKAGSSIACLVPGSILNGHHHERFRRRAFLTAKRPVALEIDEIWQIAHGTFKYPGAAVIGHKRARTTGLAKKKIRGFFAAPGALNEVEFSVQTIGAKRTAWLLSKEGAPVSASGDAAVPPQGADLMPRMAVCVEIVDKIGAEWRVDTPQKASPWHFTVKAAKELKGARFPGRVARRFIHRIAQSENLLPFVLGQHRSPIAIPTLRDRKGDWVVLDEAEIRGMGLTQTARRFRAINQSLQSVGKGTTLQERIDERRKLTRQIFPQQAFIVLSGAGGKHICAACIPAEEAKNLVIDQTLYWQVYSEKDAAWYCTGMLNSHALTEAISPFNPKGDFGERHIHTLPYRLLPPYDPTNEDHARIASLAQEITAAAATIINGDAYLNDPSRALTARRRKLRKQLRGLATFQEMETLCAAALGTTAFGDAEDEDTEGGDE